MSMMVQSGRFGGGGGGGAGVAYRYVGVRCIKSGDGYVGCSQLSMFESGGVTDLCLGATMASTGTPDNGFVAANLNDGNSSTFYASSDNTASTVGSGATVLYADFGSGNAYAVAKIGWRTRTSQHVQSPTYIEVVGKDNSGDPWTHIAFLPVQAWSGDEYRELSFTPAPPGGLVDGYRYYRLTISAGTGGGSSHVSINELGLRVAAGSGDNMSPFHDTVTVASFLAGGFEGWRAANGLETNNGWYSGVTTYPKTWKIDFGATRKVDLSLGDYYLLRRTGDPNVEPKSWTFEGSNDDSSWDLLDTQTNITSWSDGVKNVYAL